MRNLRTRGPFEDSSRCRRERAIVIASSSNTISSLHSTVSTVLSDSSNIEFPTCRSAIAPDYGTSDHAVILVLENSVYEVYRNSSLSCSTRTSTRWYCFGISLTKLSLVAQLIVSLMDIYFASKDVY